MNYTIMSKNIIPEAVEQIESMAKVFDKEKIVMMPDYHAGKGCVVGTTMVLKDRVCPNYIGVDIGCSVYAQKISKKVITFDEETLKELDRIIHEYIPSGMSVRHPYGIYTTKSQDEMCKREAKNVLELLRIKLPSNVIDRALLSIGSLGSGNHFVELGETKDYYWLFVHTGSRNLGVHVAKYYQELAIKRCNEKRTVLMKDMIQYVPKLARQEFIENFKKGNPIIDKEHCYLTGQDMEDYIHDMRLVQKYAHINRITMLNTILYHLGIDDAKGDLIRVFHNYIGSDGILRKGAISAHFGEDVLIPLNMRDGVIYGKGKGNVDWNYSAPHGAGRIMSRKEAFNSLNVDEFKKSMNGIFTTCVNNSTLDESPMAYKPMEEIIEAIGDTITILDIIKPIYNFKVGENINEVRD